MTKGSEITQDRHDLKSVLGDASTEPKDFLYTAYDTQEFVKVFRMCFAVRHYINNTINILRCLTRISLIIKILLEGLK